MKCPVCDADTSFMVPLPCGRACAEVALVKEGILALRETVEASVAEIHAAVPKLVAAALTGPAYIDALKKVYAKPLVENPEARDFPVGPTGVSAENDAKLKVFGFTMAKSPPIGVCWVCSCCTALVGAFVALDGFQPGGAEEGLARHNAFESHFAKSPSCRPVSYV